MRERTFFPNPPLPFLSNPPPPFGRGRTKVGEGKILLLSSGNSED